MRDKTRLMITGAVALVAVAATVGSHGFNFDLDFGGDGDAPEAASNLANLKDFTGIALTGPDDMIITQAPAFSVRAEGDPRAVKHLKFYLRDGTLHVTRERRGGWFSGHDTGATIRVALPALTSVALMGSGTIRVDKLAGSRVTAEVTGPGDLSIAQLDAETADLKLTGSGDMTAIGQAKTASLNATGSGNIQAEKLNTEHASLKLLGSGDIFVHASEGADVSIMGSGDAHVAGTTACKVSKMGSGDANCAS